MKKILYTSIISLTVGFTTSLASAESINGNITDHYKTVINKTPYSVEVCQDVATSGDKTGDTLKGAIIGGIIGNNVGDIENGGAAGAIIGGILGHNNSKVTGGTKRVCSVETRYRELEQQLYSYSTVSFISNGKRYSLKFKK